MIVDDSWGQLNLLLRILPNHQIFVYSYTGKTLERVAKFSYWGVGLDENLSWKDHVENVSSKVSRRHA